MLLLYLREVYVMKKFLAAFLTICFIIAIGVSAVNLEQVEEIA